CLAAKFNSERITIIRSNGIPSSAANKSSLSYNKERKLSDNIADTINDSEFCRKVREAYKYEREVRQLHVAKPIILNEHIELKNKYNHNISSDKYEKNDEMTNKDIEIIYQYDENHENQFEDEENYIFFSSEWDHDFSFAEHTIHSADDENAK
ncbi:15515_t:CDS:2, partial [Gigaspora margarita]